MSTKKALHHQLAAIQNLKHKSGKDHSESQRCDVSSTYKQKTSNYTD